MVSRSPVTQALAFKLIVEHRGEADEVLLAAGDEGGSGAPRPSTAFDDFSKATMPQDSASQCALSQASQRSTSAWPRRSEGQSPLSGRLPAR